MRWRKAVGAAAVFLGGCELGSNQHYRNSDVIRDTPSPAVQQANVEAATRVDSLGRSILASAKPRLETRPLFRTVGSPEPEIFHKGVSDIYITQGLIDRCKSDGELAAILCLELGKMVAEREALLTPEERRSRALPPLDAGIRKDIAGAATEPDQFRLMELAKFEKERDREALQAPAEPEALAKIYLKRAGFAPADLDHVKPLVSSAAKNSTLQKQTVGSPMTAAAPQFLPPNP
jgi:predicted Zn-dependent protease